MNRTLLRNLYKVALAVLGSGCVSSAFAEATLAFPEAVGFGAYATGGRTGKVYHVTNLNDSGVGSFRDAVSQGNRIVVFDVGGYVKLKTAVQIKSNITIAGQTAPGEGIGFEGGKLSCGSQSNIIIRHIRIRPGSETASVKDDGLNMLYAENCIIDHCSVEFSPWNNIGGTGKDSDKSTDITFQYCLIADPIYQQFGAHIESVNSQWTWYRNCFANTHNRNPLDKVNDVFVNNIHYNYQAGYTTHTSTKFKHDIVNNYFVGGPSSGSTDNTWFQVDKNQSIYYSGNMKDRNKDGVLNGAETTPYWYQGTGTVLSAPWSEQTNKLEIVSAATAYRLVSSQAGTLPADELDRLIWSQVYSLGKSGQMYKSQAETGLGNNGYGTIVGGVKEDDSDGDGMPDYWENAMDLDNTKDDAMTITSDGYANIEKYINFLGGLHGRCKQGASVNINVSEYFKGWNGVSPVYSVSNAVNGTVSLGADGKTAVFTPKAGFYGMASFSMTVKGNDNTTYTSKINILVEPEAIDTADPELVKNGAGRSTQTVELGTALTDFSYVWAHCSTVEVKWTPFAPEGVSVVIDPAEKRVSFSGTPKMSGTYSFVVTTVSDKQNVSKEGTIVVGDGKFPAANMTKHGGGSSNQQFQCGESISPFYYNWSRANTVDVTWEPYIPFGINVEIRDKDTAVHFSGTPNELGTFRFKIVTVGNETPATKSGSLTIVAKRCDFNGSISTDWSDKQNWENGLAPLDCDSAIIVSEEAQVSSDVASLVFVENGATLRILGSVDVPNLTLEGGSLKSSTSETNPTVSMYSNLMVKNESNIQVGSAAVSELEIDGTISGTTDLHKKRNGILKVSSDASDFAGEWIVEAGTLAVLSETGLGVNGVTINEGATLVISRDCSTGNLVSVSPITLNADLTVETADFNGTKLVTGTYDATTMPEFIKGDGKLVVTNSSITGDIEETAATTALSVYPNPTDGEVNICGKVVTVGSVITIVDMLGNEVYTKAVTNDGTERIDVSRLSEGVYIVRVDGDSSQYSCRLIVK